MLVLLFYYYYFKYKKTPVKWLTEGLQTTYRRCNPQFVFKAPFIIPRRVLTTPSVPQHNEGMDNENYDLIMHVGDVIGSAVSGEQSRQCWRKGTQYTVIDMLGQGTFGQVVKCRDEERGTLVAVKILKNKAAYFKQGLLEVGVLTAVNSKCDPDKRHRTLRLLDHFLFRNHLCIVNELLSSNLYEQLKEGNFRGVSVRLIRSYLRQLLDAMTAIEAEHIVHCDLKPENILLDRARDEAITLIDFGSACFEDNTMYTYIQSRHYRSPEVIMGLQYTCAIDMWSLGCIAAELILGIPLFPGANEYNQLYKITSMLGAPPPEMVAAGSSAYKFFKPDPLAPGAFVLKSQAEFERENGVRLDPDKRYVPYTSLDDMLAHVRLNTGYSHAEISPAASPAEIRRSFLDFLKGVLQLDPSRRWTPAQALQHPFLTEQPLGNAPFVPPPPARPPRKNAPPSRKNGGGSGGGGNNTFGSFLRGTTAEMYRRYCDFMVSEHRLVDVATGATLTTLPAVLHPSPYVEGEVKEKESENEKFRRQQQQKAMSVESFPNPPIAIQQQQQQQQNASVSLTSLIQGSSAIPVAGSNGSGSGSGGRRNGNNANNRGTAAAAAASSVTNARLSSSVAEGPSYQMGQRFGISAMSGTTVTVGPAASSYKDTTGTASSVSISIVRPPQAQMGSGPSSVTAGAPASGSGRQHLDKIPHHKRSTQKYRKNYKARTSAGKQSGGFYAQGSGGNYTNTSTNTAGTGFTLGPSSNSQPKSSSFGYSDMGGFSTPGQKFTSSPSGPQAQQMQMSRKQQQQQQYKNPMLSPAFLASPTQQPQQYPGQYLGQQSSSITIQGGGNGQRNGDSTFGGASWTQGPAAMYGGGGVGGGGGGSSSSVYGTSYGTSASNGHIPRITLDKASKHRYKSSFDDDTEMK